MRLKKFMGVLSSVSILGMLVFSASPALANTSSINLDGTDDMLSITDANQTDLDFSGDVTMEMWINLSSNIHGELISKWDGANSQREYVLELGDAPVSDIRFSTSSNGTNGAQALVSWHPDTNRWYHVAVTYDASAGTAEFFIDGESIGIASGLHSSIYNGSADFLVGGSYTGNFFHGKIDDVRIWDHVRTPGEIASNYQRELTGNEPGLISYWKMSRNGEDSVVSSGNDLTENGTLGYAQNVPFVAYSKDVDLAIKSADESVTNSTTLQNDDDLGASLLANSEYVLDGVLFAKNANIDGDLKIALDVPTSTEFTVGYVAFSGNAVVGTGVLNEDGVASPKIQIPAYENAIIQLTGTVRTSNSSGELHLQWAQDAASPTSTRLLDGGFVRVYQK